MGNKPGHRRFGNLRKLRSGLYQVRYPGPDGRMRTAPRRFERKRDAERYLSLIEAQQLRGEWVDPERGKVRLQDYALNWIAQRPGLRPRTAELYGWLLHKHIAPYLGDVPVAKITPEMVREWRAQLLGNGVSQSMAAKAYRLLRAVLMTAADEDEVIPRNPCRIRGAGDEKAGERPVLSIGQVFELADRMRDRRFRALVLLATFASLRWGEVIALRRRDLDLEAGVVTVRAAFIERRGEGLALGPPKSRAGRRRVSIPRAILPALREHAETYTESREDALVFTGAKGSPLRRGNFNKASGWLKAVDELGVPGLHFHDLRHTGNTLAARGGASLRDLMARMGHDNVRAAIAYQHASSEEDRAIADALSARVEAAWRTDDDDSEEDEEQDSGDDDDDGGAAGVPAPVS